MWRETLLKAEQQKKEMLKRETERIGVGDWGVGGI